MKVKLTLDEPVIVSQGPTVEEAGWGTHQFPAINKDDSGNIGVTFHRAKDSMEAYGTEPYLYVSKDNGNSWKQIPDELVHDTKTHFGTRLPNGDRLWVETRTPIPVDIAKLPEPILKKYTNLTYYAAEDIKNSLLEKRWRYLVLKNGETTPEYKYISQEFKGMNIWCTNGALVPPFPFGHIRIAPDNTVWQTTYMASRNPENFGMSPYYNSHFFKFSQDFNSLSHSSWIPYIPDTRTFADSFLAEGFGEPDIVFMEDGSCITVIRTGASTPSFLARSTDQCKTWSKPVIFDDKGVWPCLCKLNNKVTLASYGRPGFYIRATSDPHGLTWDEPVEIITSKDRTCERNTKIDVYNHTSRMGTCSYSDMVALDDNTAMVVYSDFFVPDEYGVKRKTILTRKVHVSV